MHVPVRDSLGLYTAKTWLFAPFEYARGRSSPFGLERLENLAARPWESVFLFLSPFGHVPLENLAVRPWASVFIPFGAHLGLYARNTWLYALERVCTSLFVTVWVCTPLKPGFSPRFQCARGCYNPFGLVRLENLALRSWTSVYVLFGPSLGQYVLET